MYEPDFGTASEAILGVSKNWKDDYRVSAHISVGTRYALNDLLVVLRNYKEYISGFDIECDLDSGTTFCFIAVRNRWINVILEPIL